MTTHREIEDHKKIAREAKKEAKKTGESVEKVVCRHYKKYLIRKRKAQQ